MKLTILRVLLDEIKHLISAADEVSHFKGAAGLDEQHFISAAG